ncbi:MAG: hypothetical protein JW822_00780 [Spirochaetales bacterium]|nr:hypothetical protein [Spirochaetales bacterium]
MKTGLLVILCCITALCSWNCGLADSGGSAGSPFAVTSNPSGLSENPEDIAIDNNYIYIIGEDCSLCGAQWDPQWRIEKRTIATGELVAAFDADGIVLLNPTNSEDYATSLVIDASYMYIAGMRDNAGAYIGCVIKINKTTGAFDNNFGNNGVLEYAGGEQAHFIVADDSFLYIIDRDGLGNRRIVKLNKITGAIIDAFGTNGVVDLQVQELAVDDSYIYAAGADLFKLNKTSGTLINGFGNAGVVDTLGSVNTIAIDNSYIYIATANPFPGSWFVEKFDIDTGDFAAGFDTLGGSTITSGTISSIAVDSAYIYLGGTDRNPPVDDWRWCIEKRDIMTGNLVPAFGTGEAAFSNPSNGNDLLSAHVVDGRFIYSIGVDNNANDGQWRLEKRDKTTGEL